MVWRSLSDIFFSDTKQQLVGCREQLRKKDTEFDSRVSHSIKNCKKKSKKILFESVKKCFFLRRLTKMPNLILSVHVSQVTFLSEDWKKLSAWSSVLFMVSALEMHEKEAYRKHGIKCGYPSQHGRHFTGWLIYGGFSVNCLMIICKYLSLSHKSDYQHSRLNTYQFVSPLQWFK